MAHAVRWDEVLKICKVIESDYQVKRKKKNGHCGEGDLIWLVPLIKFAFMSGMRISELARLRWEDLDLDRGTVLIKKQKSRKISSIPLSETAIHLLKEVKRQNSCPFVFASPRLRSSERSTHAFCNRVSKSFAKYRIKARISEKCLFTACVTGSVPRSLSRVRRHM